MAVKSKKGSSKKLTKKQLKTIKVLIYINIAILVGILAELVYFYH